MNNTFMIIRGKINIYSCLCMNYYFKKKILILSRELLEMIKIANFGQCQGV